MALVSVARLENRPGIGGGGGAGATVAVSQPPFRLTESEAAALGPLRLGRLAGPDAIDALAPEWEALDAELSPRTPFTTPLWNRLWWHHLRMRGLLVRDRFFVLVLRDRDGRLVAVAPLMMTHRPGFGPLRLRQLQFFGADPNLTEIRGLICRPQDQERAIQALAAALPAQVDGWDWLKWGRLPADSPACARLVRQGAMMRTGEVPDYVLDLPVSWPAFRQGLPRNIKESLRKCYNSLKREGHDYRLRVVERPEEIPAALDTFFALHAARAAAPFEVRHRDMFAEPRARQFIADYAAEMARRGQLRLFQLEIGGVVRATRMGFLLGDELYLYYSGYDPAWAKYSIMTTVVAEAVRWAIGEGLSVVNLSAGNDVSKTRWRPREVLHAEAVQVAPRLRSQLAFHLFEAAQHGSRGTSPVGRLLAACRRHLSCSPVGYAAIGASALELLA